jgi:hypothetical protein
MRVRGRARVDLLLREIDARLDVRAQVDQRIDERMDPARELARERTRGAPRRLGARGIDEVGDALGLREGRAARSGMRGA